MTTKNKMKNYLKLGIFLFGISIVLTNCLHDTTLEHSAKKRVHAKRISLKDFKQKQQVNEALLKFEKHVDYYKKAHESYSKINAIDSTFSILTDEIIEVVTDSTEAYTFRIEIPTHTVSLFENFVIEKFNNGTYKYYIYRYRNNTGTTRFSDLDEDMVLMTRELIDSSQIDSDDFNDYIAQRIIYDETTGCLFSLEQNDDCSCEILYVLQCDNINPGGGGSYGDGSGGDSSDGGSDSDGGGSGGGSGSGGDGGGSTVGVLPSTETPCDELNDLTDTEKADVKDNLIELKENSTAEDGETGFKLQKDSTGVYTSPSLIPTNTNSILVPAGGTNYGGAHSHPTSTFPLFSWADVYILYNLYKYADAGVKNEVVMLLTSTVIPANAEVYAIKINDFNAFKIQIGLDFQNITAFDPNLVGASSLAKIKALNEHLGDKYKKDSNNEKVFLKYFKNHNISLYKATSLLDDWSELTLQDDFSGTVVVNTPCN